MAWAIPAFAQDAATNAGASALAKEVAGRGWILFAGKSAQGDYDLFLCRPDGSTQRNLTQTPDADEFGGRFSADGSRMLYRRQVKRPGDKGFNHDLWGTQGALVFAKADGSEAQAQGEEGEYPWASWSPDGKNIACLYKREGLIRIFELSTKKLVKEMPRQGIFQQLFWSPDGKRLCGTANVSGQDWNIVSIDLSTGQAQLLSRALNCTPDWFQGDPNKVIYSNRTPGVGSANGWTMLMQAGADGQGRTLVCGESGRHLYYACTSPDDKYVIYSRLPVDGGREADMAVVRLADTPIIVQEDYAALRLLYPNARSGPVLHLHLAGFEPYWTYAELGAK